MQKAKAKKTLTAVIARLRSNPPRVLDYEEASYYLTVSPRNLQSLVEQGKIPRVKIGRRVMFRLEDLDNTLRKLAV
jgi:excisionase family DNA binding protein